MKNHIVSTLFHLLELILSAVIALGIAYIAHKAFGIDLSSTLTILLTLIINALGKFVRTSPNVPIPDYVNKR